MIPSAIHVMKKRHASKRRLRFISVALVLTGLLFFSYSLSLWLIEIIGSPMLQLPYILLQGLQFLFAFGIPAVLLAILSPRLIKWLVPMPDLRCPACGYELKELKTPRCPECGITIDAVDRIIDCAND